MQTYRVRCYRAGTWDKIDSRKVEAASAREAAEKVCAGESLSEAGTIGQLRAEVWLSDRPVVKTAFFAAPGSN
jgi:hypothetical protein